jgi:sulfite reductase (ferredoxin)
MTLLEQTSHEIDQYEAQLASKLRGELDDAVFNEMRLRRGVYGQRYDNGKRHDGTADQRLGFADKPHKGVGTLWDAPGMQRIKIPYGGLSCAQMEVLADVADEFADGVLHVTTRQDIQLHYVHIDDTPALMRRLATVDITTREACGNVIRNVTACAIAGVCRSEVFDVTPYAKATHHFMLGHPDAQGFGRKFKIAFSGCAERPCALARIHDVGLVARMQEGKRGFAMLVGGGLGAVPYQAQVLYEFVPVEDLLPTLQAIARVFTQRGEKQNRARARLKFLVDKAGLQTFDGWVRAERGTLAPDPRWTEFPDVVEVPPPADPAAVADDLWSITNTEAQRQGGYRIITVRLPLGDLSSTQMRGLSSLARRHLGDTVRTNIEQNILLRYVPEAKVAVVRGELAQLGLASAGAGTVADVTACPGTDTCKLGIASSRGLGAELEARMQARLGDLDPKVRGLRIKISGCFNSCAQHHVADIGFWGVSRKVRGITVPHFQVVLGGRSS